MSRNMNEVTLEELYELNEAGMEFVVEDVVITDVHTR